MTQRTHALFASLASGCPDWRRTYALAVEAEKAHARERDELFGFTERERAWFRRPLTATVQP